MCLLQATGLCARASTSCHLLSLKHQADCLQDLHYLASITLDSGKVFALFVKSPARVSLCAYWLPVRHQAFALHCAGWLAVHQAL